ncbi:hypothetical protein TSOC_010527 [Tetrabaena socialis]|uniref:Uncharacterized protein n=1 Tax=Tetrabaena socialis TaxID=47790 RepID=A0A2J7ZT09_9CHLO|nr:hypothetical protein TSOC_010527 [Tetrabaena socialis]|eukprot:PNH03414.1 hypothetical protein TSOC_010527 [Tetrabaena socialis]
MLGVAAAWEKGTSWQMPARREPFKAHNDHAARGSSKPANDVLAMCFVHLLRLGVPHRARRPADGAGHRLLVRHQQLQRGLELSSSTSHVSAASTAGHECGLPTANSALLLIWKG